ncbi:hypothetical protein MJO28_001580 [Puccinia striiformis f. sp. tritici]|uniref:Uncharacterized protein n=1 Tax=Puccinia striiformis f. sp. tritici TaxID=168172 RepID=A0ACC0EUD3_9BASI|nr:hypothetical protein Pst134EB_004231 [Puccinia striiformis f. sp. tritici]KAI7961091.1 hypothetical protein MJO28_001580 [Puccinia striiformis f. sp. tritici]
MASPQAVSPAALATASANPSANASASGNAKSPTASKPTAAEAASPISGPQATPASPQTITPPSQSNASIAESSPQHPATSQAAKSPPTIVSSPNPNQSAFPSAASHPKSIPETPGKSPATPNVDTSSDAPSSSSSLTGPVIGSVVALLVFIAAVVGGVWFLHRRRQKARMRQEATRMRSSNFGRFEPGELIHEKRGSIEATLEADLARLRKLDSNIPIVVDDYDAECPEPPVHHFVQPVPPLLVARKPSQRARNKSGDDRSKTRGYEHESEPASPISPPYNEHNQPNEQDYICPPPTMEHGFPMPPESTVLVHTPGPNPVYQNDGTAHHPPAFFAPVPESSDDASRSDSINDFQRWASNQGHIEPSSFDQNNWPQSPSIDNSNRDVSPLYMAIQSSYSLPPLPPTVALPPLPTSRISTTPTDTNPLQFTIHNADIDANRKLITLSVEPSRDSKPEQNLGKPV